MTGPRDDEDPISNLGEVLADIRARVTFDPQRSAARPCCICGTTTDPRNLVMVGTYTRRMGGGIMPGDRIERAMCRACDELTAEPAAPSSR